MKNKNGFTLVEIMIVVVIIGLLAAMAIPAFNSVRQSSTASSALNDLRQIAAGADQYFLVESATSVSLESLTPTYVKTLDGGHTYPATITHQDTQITATTAFGTVVTYEMGVN